jgi:hypothetical protein
MSNLYRGSSIDASYQVSVHLAKQFERRRFLKTGTPHGYFWSYLKDITEVLR